MSPRQKFHLLSFPAARLSMLFACALLLLGCDQVKERAGFADPTKMEAEGKAIGDMPGAAWKIAISSTSWLPSQPSLPAGKK
jgi:hypothetical protein